MRNLITRNEELFRRSLLLSSLFMMVIAIAVSKNAVLDPDMGWHLRTGQWILDNRSLPREDPFVSGGAKMSP